MIISNADSIYTPFGGLSIVIVKSIGSDVVTSTIFDTSSFDLTDCTLELFLVFWTYFNSQKHSISIILNQSMTVYNILFLINFHILCNDWGNS